MELSFDLSENFFFNYLIYFYTAAVIHHSVHYGPTSSLWLKFDTSAQMLMSPYEPRPLGLSLWISLAVNHTNRLLFNNCRSNSLTLIKEL